MIDKLQKEIKLPGWRKIKHIRKSIKSIFRATSHQVFKGKKNHSKTKCKTISGANEILSEPLQVHFGK
jgi:hypothetical protein